MNPTITVHVITWNEELFLPWFLRHYSFADKIVVHDNQSDDRTRDIAASDSRVTVETFGTDHEQRNSVMKSIKNNCWKEDRTTWSIVCDADEFLIVTTEELEKYAETPCACQADGWQMVGEGESLPDIARGIPFDPMHKCVLFSPKIGEINYTTGCHQALTTAPIVSATELRHYNMLSEDFTIARWKRYVSRMSQEDRRHGWGKHYLISEQRMRKRFRETLQRSVSRTPLETVWQTSVWRQNEQQP